MPGCSWCWGKFSELYCKALSSQRPTGLPSLCVCMCVSACLKLLLGSRSLRWPTDSSVFKWVLKVSACSFFLGRAIYVEQSCTTLYVWTIKTLKPAQLHKEKNFPVTASPLGIITEHKYPDLKPFASVKCCCSSVQIHLFALLCGFYLQQRQRALWSQMLMQIFLVTPYSLWHFLMLFSRRQRIFIPVTASSIIEQVPAEWE